ncbi:hypothetical protein Tco_1220012 [Tanacetum coccineum]
MTRSLTKELFTPFEKSEREFRSSRKLFKRPSLDESSSPEFDLFYDLEEHSEEEVEVILFYIGLEVLTRQIFDSKGAIPTKTTADANVAGTDNQEKDEKQSQNDKTRHGMEKL